MSLEVALQHLLVELRTHGLELPWTCLFCEHVNDSWLGNCESCKSANEKYPLAVAALQGKTTGDATPSTTDHLLVLLSRKKGPCEIEGCVQLFEAMKCEQEDLFEEATRHYRRAYRLWPELDSALHSDGVPTSLRAEADMLLKPLEHEQTLALACRCLPVLVEMGMDAGYIDSAESRCVQRLWTGMGHIVKITLHLSSGLEHSFVAKVISIGVDATCWLKRDEESYFVEAAFYSQGHAKCLQSLGAACPQVLLVDETERGRLILCMTELLGQEHKKLSKLQTLSVLAWLARLHAYFWGTERADAAVASGLHAEGCYWCLSARHKELESVLFEGLKGRLRRAASAIDARLKLDCLQTICHGDAKGANMLFSDDQHVGLLDFQWVGKASAAKDLAYLLICGRPDHLDPEVEQCYLQHYHAELSALLRAQGDEPPAIDHLQNSYMLAVCDLARFQCAAGWWGNLGVLQSHAETLLSSLDGGKLLPSENSYHDALFKAFPL
eukprot:TRINITY_DN77316_c0_g1_i1.p1 TRINITY_DN77316_c0_g1~~TRINITY_DN77316_c0_g1_i1.p1  ORF type:complete len:508 (-),score=71.29 TRINITY_DN77316_c0_g1_i1:34-1524(-)